jgi:hypothetical protein
MAKLAWGELRFRNRLYPSSGWRHARPQRLVRTKVSGLLPPSWPWPSVTSRGASGGGGGWSRAWRGSPILWSTFARASRSPSLRARRMLSAGCGGFGCGWLWLSCGTCCRLRHGFRQSVASASRLRAGLPNASSIAPLAQMLLLVPPWSPRILRLSFRVDEWARRASATLFGGHSRPPRCLHRSCRRWNALGGHTSGLERWVA